jgi:hypothetical protein
MTARWMKATLLFVAFGFAIGAGGCIMEDRTVEFVLSDSTCVSFSEDETDAVFFGIPVSVYYSDEIDRILRENDVGRGDIVAIKIVSALYTVTRLDQEDDWTITGAITVARTDIGHEEGPLPLVNYTSQSLREALGTTVPAEIDSAGVALLDGAFADFLAGGNPILTFQVANSDVVPPPSESNPIRFDWKACVWIDFVTKSEVSVPDPF